MKVHYTIACFCSCILFVSVLFGQNGIIGAGFTPGWNNPADVICFDAGVGNSRIKTLNANGTGNQFFRIVRCWDYGFGNDYTEHTAQGQPCVNGNDLDISSQLGTSFNLQGCGAGAFFFNVSSTSHNYIFKTPSGDGAARFMAFNVEGTVRQATSVSTTAPDCPDVNRVVSASLDGSLSNGQGVYLRYSNDNFATATIVEMTCFGSSCFFDIPASVNTAGSTVSYYVFTSGDGLTIPDAERDFYSINITNNGGANYSYMVPASAIVAEAGNDTSICTNGVVDLTSIGASISGSYVNARTKWETSGDGTFNGDGTFDNTTTYTPDSADIADGTVTLKLISFTDSDCNNEDTVVVSIIPTPQVTMNIIAPTGYAPLNNLGTNTASGPICSGDQLITVQSTTTPTDGSGNPLWVRSVNTIPANVTTFQLVPGTVHVPYAAAGPPFFLQFGDMFINTGTVPETVRVVVTPYYETAPGLGASLDESTECFGPDITIEVIVNPGPVLTDVSANLCGSSASSVDLTQYEALAGVPMTLPAGASLQWFRGDSSTGMDVTASKASVAVADGEVFTLVVTYTNGCTDEAAVTFSLDNAGCGDFPWQGDN